MKLTEILSTIIHPELQKNIIELGMVGDIKQEDNTVFLTLRMPKKHDSSANPLRRAVQRAIEENLGLKAVIVISEPAPVTKQQKAQTELRENTTTSNIKQIIAVSSGKGGVGKSTVTANLAVALSMSGYKVGVLDVDIYGPSMPKMFGVEDYVPVPADDEGKMISPAENHGVKVMSIGFFIKGDDALAWRGPMATSALRQLVHQTQWGELDFLLLDLPPGTGDIHLTIVNELKINAAVIVTTPQMVALADVVRGISLFKSEHINVPVIGIVENMAYFKPSDSDKTYYIFGKGKTQEVANECGVEVLQNIPLDEFIATAGDDGVPYILGNSESEIADAYMNVAQKIINFK